MSEKPSVKFYTFILCWILMVIETTLRQQNVFLHRRYSKSTSENHTSIIVERCVMVSGACVWRSVGGVITDRDRNADHCSQPPSVSVLAVLCRLELQTNLREELSRRRSLLPILGPSPGWKGRGTGRLVSIDTYNFCWHPNFMSQCFQPGEGPGRSLLRPWL